MQVQVQAHKNGAYRAEQGEQGVRLPPSNRDAEEAVLGSLLIDPEAYLEAGDLQPEHFFSIANGWIFEAMLELANRDEPIDTLTLLEELRRRGRLQEVGGEPYIIGLVSSVPTSLNAWAYARIVQEAAQRRALIAAAGQIATMGWDEEGDIESQLDEAERAIFELRARTAEQRTYDAPTHAHRYLERLERLKESEDELSGIETSIPALDTIMNGLKKGKLYYVLGRPGMGKSTLGIGMAWHNAHALKGKQVFLWSGEMDVEEVDNLIVAKETRIPSNHLDNPARLKNMGEQAWQNVYGAATALAQSSLIIDDDAGLTVPQLRSKLMRAHMRYGQIDLVVLDHLHLMETTGRAENETVAVSRISQELRILAKDLNVPIVCLAQLSRDVERRQDKRPTMADAKQAGKIEEDAYGMVMVYRDDYYNPDTSLDMGLAELLVRKNRGGRLGMTKVRFVEELPAFEPVTGQVVQL